MHALDASTGFKSQIMCTRLDCNKLSLLLQGVSGLALENALKTVGNFAAMFPATQFPGAGLGVSFLCTLAWQPVVFTC